MPHPVTGIDHVFLLVHNLDAAAEQWRRLGFTVSPKGWHSAHMGTANHTIMFEEDYVELLGIVAPTPANAAYRATLAADEGIATVACQIADTREGVQVLRARGVSIGDPVDFERPVELSDGTTSRAAFTVASFAPDAVPLGHAFLCQHHTRETVWQPGLRRHANGARALAGLFAAIDHPEGAAHALAGLFGAGRTTPVAGGFEVATGTAAIVLLEPRALRQRFPGLRPSPAPYAAVEIRCTDLAEARRCVAGNGVATHETQRGFAVAAEDAAGAIVAFVG